MSKAQEQAMAWEADAIGILQRTRIPAVVHHREGDMSIHFILNDKREVIPADTLTWARWFEKADRRVAENKLGDVRVSTVFLGLDHSFGVGPPLIFETMIFGGPHDQYQERYSTWSQAESGHAKAVALAKRGRKIK